MTTAVPARSDRAVSGLARFVSLAAAAGLAGFLFVYPRVLGSEPGGAVYGPLVMMMIGISAAFAHGVGFVPKNRHFRWCFGPILAWPLMACGAALLFL